MVLAAIVATDKDLGIGLNNRLPWPNHSEDMKRFKAVTMGCPVIMGRKTWESLGRLLPGRMNVVITRDRNYVDNPNFKAGLCVVNDLDTAIQLCHASEKAFIIGGAEIYIAAQDKIEELYHTVVHGEFEHDTALPESFFDAFVTESGGDFGPDEKNPNLLTFNKLRKKN